MENNFRFFKIAKFEFKVTVGAYTIIAYGQNAPICDLLNMEDTQQNTEHDNFRIVTNFLLKCYYYFSSK